MSVSVVPPPVFASALPGDPADGLEGDALYSARVEALRGIGRLFHHRGWSWATSSNYSVLLTRSPFRLLITASGRDKGRLGPDDFVVVDEAGRPVAPGMPKPSAETLLHTVLAARPDVGAVLHTHSVWGTILSDLHGDRGELVIEGYEMLKALPGVATHEHRHRIEIFPNTQDIPDLAARLRPWLDTPGNAASAGFLMRRHGLYTWGRTLADALRHIEALEFLFEVVGRSRSPLSP